ncbi:MAG: NAD(P)-binding domain-containing protein, partial [Actinomycetota bacterium]
MTKVAVLGAGNGGLAAAADLARRGHTVRLFNRSPGPIRAVEAAGGIRASGALEDGLAPIQTATTSLEQAVKGADAIVIVLPAVAHADVAVALAGCMEQDVPVILNPGQMCGSLHL